MTRRWFAANSYNAKTFNNGFYRGNTLNVVPDKEGVELTAHERMIHLRASARRQTLTADDRRIHLRTRDN